MDTIWTPDFGVWIGVFSACNLKENKLMKVELTQERVKEIAQLSF